MTGDRIRQARLAAGLTLDNAVEQMRLLGEETTKQSLSNYERGKRTPHPTLLLKLARALNVKPGYFMTESRVTIAWAAYRCQVSLCKRDKEALEAFAQTAAERQMYLQTTLFPGVSPTFPSRVRVGDHEGAEKAAESARKEWALGLAAIESLTRTIENNAGIIVEYPMGDIKFDGLSGWVNQRFPIVVVNSGVPDDRIRFNLAHELGHLAMDCEDVIPREAEALAHRFAGALLVPAEVVRRELGASRRIVSFEELAVLKQKYGLSMQAWLHRAFDLGIITQSYYKGMRIEFNKRGWNKVEPVPYEGDERPARLKQMVFRAVAEGVISAQKAKALCPECRELTETSEAPESRPFGSPSDLLRLPRSMRRAILARAAQIAEKEYRENRSLTDFEAFGEEDLEDE